ncbi:MAG TPA: AI-2E family transporter, partial [Thermoanaerobaculia bacterium]
MSGREGAIASRGLRSGDWGERGGAGEDPERSVLELHVPVSTILKVLVTALIVWAVLKLIPEFLFFLLALLLAISIAPLVSRLEARGMKRGMAVVIVAVLTVVTVVGFVVLVGPPLMTQLMTLVEHFPEYQRRVQGRISPDHPMIKKVVEQIFAIPSSPEIASSLRRPLAWGEAAVAGVTVAVLVLSLTLYLVADGKRTYAWLLAYVPRRHRKKMAETIPEVSEVVIAYVQGQALTSFLFGAFSLVVLLVFKVPAAVPLAVLAAVCDVLPVIGLIAATVPAVLLALTVSPVAAGSVLALYLLYHLLENTVIIPRVYGRRLALSTLAVMIALVIGGRLYGVLGAILILPFVAAYPIVERIWLHEYLSDEVVRDHKALEAAAESGSDRAVEKVLKG